MEIVKATLTGVAPLLMNNGQMADPTNKYAIELAEATKASNRKTIEGIALIRRIEWFGHSYRDDKGRFGVPADSILALVIAGAKKSKQGGEAKMGVYEAADFFPLIYDGPKEAEALFMHTKPSFVDVRGVKQGLARIMRTRPIFRAWKLEIALMVNPELMDPKSVERAITNAGLQVGLGDFRPRFGRFETEIIKAKKAAA